MSYVSSTTGYIFLMLFGVGMIAITYLFTRIKRWNTADDFIIAGRRLGWFYGGISIAASWIWAPALFLSSQFSYEMGLAGIFWFTFPNVLALAIFYFLGPKIRELLPEGYTMPQFIKERLRSNKVHKLYLAPYLFMQLMAITVQLYAGGNLVSLLTGIPLMKVMPILLLIALTYSLISGLESSVVTDFVQMTMIFVIGAIILPLTWKLAGGVSAITEGLVGVNGINSIFDPGVALSFGIVTSISLLAASISDQQYWQRTFALKKNHVRLAFIWGAIVFAVVPLALSTLGFLAANPTLGVSLPVGIDASMIGVQTVANILPGWALLLFVIMLLSGLSSTLDSGLSATSSLWVTDVIRGSKSDKEAIRSARKAMTGVAILGLLLALLVHYIPGFGLAQLFWIINVAAATIAVPTVLSLFWTRLSARGVYWGVLTSFVLGLPLFIYSNVVGNSSYIVGSSLLIILLSTLFCIAMPKKVYVED